MIRAGVVLVLIGAVLAGCNREEDSFAFDGKFFRSSSKSNSDDRRGFVVTVRQAAGSEKGALLAGDHEGTSYCVLNFGNSEIDWTVGPDQDPETVTLDGGSLVLLGRCEG